MAAAAYVAGPGASRASPGPPPLIREKRSPPRAPGPPPPLLFNHESKPQSKTRAACPYRGPLPSASGRWWGAAGLGAGAKRLSGGWREGPCGMPGAVARGRSAGTGQDRAAAAQLRRNSSSNSTHSPPGRPAQPPAHPPPRRPPPPPPPPWRAPCRCMPSPPARPWRPLAQVPAAVAPPCLDPSQAPPPGAGRCATRKTGLTSVGGAGRLCASGAAAAGRRMRCCAAPQVRGRMQVASLALLRGAAGAPGRRW